MKLFRDENLLKPSGRQINSFITFLLLMSTLSALASAGGGGGGGGSSGGDGGDGIGGLLLYLILSIPFPYNIILLALIIFLGFITRKKVRASSGLNSIASFDNFRMEPENIPAEFLQRNPNFSREAFLSKVNTAFMQIQDAWMRKDLRVVRKYISDGVWQRFNTQFIMMNALAQRNTMSDISIRNMRIDNIEQDGNYDIIDVGIHFTMMDNFINDKFPQLNQEGALENVEYWTFIRRSGVAEKDMYHSNNCPNCGNQLPQNMGEVSKCESCGTITTLGDYDWVLSEITQNADYVNEYSRLGKNGGLTNKIRASLNYDKDFSVQQLEDKASNAYMQIMTSLVMKKPEITRRFVGNELFTEVEQKIKTDPPYVFNRLYLNNVTMVDYYKDGGKDNLVVAFKRTAQRIGFANNQFYMLDGAMYTTNEFMVMSRDIGAGNAKGSLYAHSCPNCAGPIGDTMDLKCQYCGAELNSTKQEWIVSALYSTQEYNMFVHNKQIPLINHTGVKDVDPLFKVRDYAFNNVMMIICADGTINAQEMEFAMRFAKKLGYDNQRIAGMFDLTKGRQLSLRLPGDRKSAEKVLAIMEKAAAADGHIAPAELAIIEDVKKHIAQMAA